MFGLDKIQDLLSALFKIAAPLLILELQKPEFNLGGRLSEPIKSAIISVLRAVNGNHQAVKAACLECDEVAATLPEV
jgi:hypothetical protein